MANMILGIGGLQECPHCGAPLAVATAHPSIDKSLEQCAKCGGVVMRRRANEWELLSNSQKLGRIARHAFLALAMGLAPPLGYLAAGLGSGRGWQVRYALLLLAAGCVLAGAWQGSRLAAMIRRSRRRMEDPMYLAKLVEYEMAAISRR